MSSSTVRIICGLLLCVVLFVVTTWFRRKNWITKEILDTLIGPLALVTIIFALIQYYDSGRQSDGIAKQADRIVDQTKILGELQNEMSTRSAGFFPKNIRDISEVVGGAKAHLDVMVDFVGYGHYSAPEDFEAYFRRIENVRDGPRPVAVRMLIYNRRKAMEIHNLQFSEADFKKELGGDNFRRFCAKFNSGKPCPKDKAEFDGLLFHRQQDYIEALVERGVEIRSTGDDLPFYFWSADDDEAVFSFLNTGRQGTREVSFRTRDPKIIIEALSGRFNSLWDRSDKNRLRINADKAGGAARTNW